jgi:dTMP kinase
MVGRGTFITLEGGEGTGKSTQVERLADWLRHGGREVVVTREPGGTPLAEAVRSVLLDPDHDPDGLVELFLLEAARRDHTERVVRPALEAGAVVVCDRYADSSTVYQGMVRGVGVAEVERLNRIATGGLEPDRTVVFDLDPREGLARARRRNATGDGSSTRLDDEPDPFHDAVRAGFLRLAEAHPERVVVVDARGPADEIFRRVLDALHGVLT